MRSAEVEVPWIVAVDRPKRESDGARAIEKLSAFNC